MRHANRFASRRGVLLTSCGLVALLVAGCQFHDPAPAPATAPPATFTGPKFLRGTVGSMATLRNYEPLLVSGFGVVVLDEPTGSATVPAFLRQHLINDMRRYGVGSASLGWADWTPARMLADPRTAIVEVHGLIPPGAVPGTRFDIYVRAAAQTQTTSLAGGTLWTTAMTVDGTDPSMMYRKQAAEGRGDIYMDPFARAEAADGGRSQMREAMVVAGGKVEAPLQIELILNQDSFVRARAIADRINERFARTTDRQLIAKPQNEQRIVLWIPPRWQQRPDELLELISVLYIGGGEGFEVRQAEMLAAVLVEQPGWQDEVVSAWRGLGRPAIPVLQDYYESSALHLQLAALEAGAWLGDGRAGRMLYELSHDQDPEIRTRVAAVLVHLPRSIQGTRALRKLLDDPQRAVRISAYESLVGIGDPTVERLAVRDAVNQVKFYIDRVPAENPLIYVTQERGLPRLVLFDKNMTFSTPMTAMLWDRRLMLRAPASDEPLTLFYQAPGEVDGRTYQLNPTVATLAYMLAHDPTMQRPQEGLDLTYAQVVDAVYHLAGEGHIDAPVELNISPLARAIERMQGDVDGDRRPEFDGSPVETADGGALPQPGQEPVPGDRRPEFSPPPVDAADGAVQPPSIPQTLPPGGRRPET